MFLGRLPIALSITLLIGVLTSIGQTFLPDEMRSIANSASPWALPAFGLAFLDRRPVPAVVLSSSSMLAMLAGYNLASMLRGYPVGASPWVF